MTPREAEQAIAKAVSEIASLQRQVGRLTEAFELIQAKIAAMEVHLASLPKTDS
jgi:hypothetical protein